MIGMTDKTRRIIQTIATKDGVSPEYVEQEMMNAIRMAMASTDPHAQALWKQISPDGREPDLDTFLSFMAERVDMVMEQQQSPRNNKKHTC